MSRGRASLGFRPPAHPCCPVRPLGVGLHLISLSSAFAGRCMHLLCGTPRPGYSWSSVVSSSALGYDHLGFGRYTVPALPPCPSRGSDGRSLIQLLTLSNSKLLLVHFLQPNTSLIDPLKPTCPC